MGVAGSRIQKKALQIVLKGLEDGGDLLSRCYAVPSALAGLTSLFGMGRGGAPPQ